MSAFSVPICDRVLLGAEEAASYCSIDASTFRRHSSNGLTPRPLRLEGRVLWRRADLDLWVALGLPTRTEFEQELSNRCRRGRT